MVAASPNGQLLPGTTAPNDSGPVECFGMAFESDNARRDYFLARLKEKLPELRQRHDFPIGEDEDILRLSDPPYYTACPNPFLAEFVEHYGKRYDPDEPYHREPFAVDVSVGKTDPLYKAHGYHTKVPHRAIVPSVLHYTKPGDFVLDGFCGSGMTGVAAQWCGTAPPKYRMELEQQWKKEGREPPTWGARRAILGDLSPAATFIAANYNIPFDVDGFAEAAQKLLDDLEEEIGWMYETLHTDRKTKGRIRYTVWSECFTCPSCAQELVYTEQALDSATGRIRPEFPCPNCGAALTKRRLNRVHLSTRDPFLGSVVRTTKRVPVSIVYAVNGDIAAKVPDEDDLEKLRKIEALPPPADLPVDTMMHKPAGEVWGDQWRKGVSSFTHVHHLFLPRAQHALSAMWERATDCPNGRQRNMLLFLTEQAIIGMSLQNRYGPLHYSQVNRHMAGRVQVSSQHSEPSPWYVLGGKLGRLIRTFQRDSFHNPAVGMTTADCSALPVVDNSVDYVFTDPPFGDNLAYSELNFLNESFLRVFTRNEPEAIVSRAQRKDATTYQRLMQRCFQECQRVLKPGRWMTLVFHNSRNAIWNAVQEAMMAAGFVVADVRVLDKRQGTFNQVKASQAVKQDLVISAYKPNGGLEQRFRLAAGTEDGVWDFVRTHLARVPLFVERNGSVEVVSERQDYLLFDRMVAFHVLRGVTVPLSAAEFYEALAQRFAQRDGMYFLPDQVVEYDRKRAGANGVLQLELFVKDEETAIQWLRHQLDRKPQTFQDIHPDYIQELGGWAKHEKMLELSHLLKENFLHYDGTGDVPPQIHAYLSTNFKDLRNLKKDAFPLRTKAKARWYVPDPHKATDLEKLRERTLLREFAEYQSTDLRRLKVFRLEAVRAGFRHAWQAQDYATIVSVGEKIPSGVIQEDPKLLMWFDQATVRQNQVV